MHQPKIEKGAYAAGLNAFRKGATALDLVNKLTDPPEQPKAPYDPEVAQKKEEAEFSFTIGFLDGVLEAIRGKKK